MGNHHVPLASLGPVNWADIPHDDLKSYLDDVFFNAQTVVDSVPSPSSHIETITGTNPPDSLEQSRKLRHDWKDVKINQRENPLDVKVYKLGAKDGKGAWFARQSVHEGLSFEQWKKGLEEELIETMKVQGQPGGGSIRGIGADRMVEQVEVPGLGKAQVFHLSAQFPGPTSPRDFVTLFLTSDIPRSGPVEKGQLLRQHMVVSKPCVHPECSPRQGMIRGQYESIELIREVSSQNQSTKRSLSSADLPVDKFDGDKASIRSEGIVTRDIPTAVEWIMVTRSDPGGSVPRFMIEKGTPPGIVNDTGKFLRWLNSRLMSNAPDAAENDREIESSGAPDVVVTETQPLRSSEHQGRSIDLGTPKRAEETEDSGSGGLWGMVTGAFWGASSAVSAGLLKSLAGADVGDDEHEEEAHHDEEDDDDEEEVSSPGQDNDAEEETLASDTSSIHTFTSALEKASTQEEAMSIMQSQPDDKSSGKSAHSKELKRLEDRRRRLDEKATKLTERWENKRQEDKDKDAAAYTKAQEKHERELAKHEAKYNRELRKLENKRAQEERKAEDRRNKAVAREERSNMTLELERVKAERDYAQKQVEMLQLQVGELQSQNTMLTTKLGRLGGVVRRDSSSSKATGQSG